MRKIIIAVILGLSLVGNAKAESEVEFSPEFYDMQKVFEQMSPDQQADVLEQAESLQLELEKMSPAQQQKLYEDSLGAMSKIDFNLVDASKLDTTQQLSVDQIDSRMQKLK